MTITVFAIVYNDYGRFIPQWVEFMKQQTVKPEMLIVLGKNHGADIKWLDDNKIKYIKSTSDNMGVLRNEAMKKIKTDFWLYFSIDDELLPIACEEIIKTNVEALSITFDAIEPNGQVRKQLFSPCINSIDDMEKWQQFWGGYVAIKGNYDLRFREDIEVPNLTLHFDLFKRGIKTVKSKKSLIVHHRWSKSHHFITAENGKRAMFVDEIEKTKNEIIREKIKNRKEFKNKKGTIVKILVPTFYIDENKHCEKNDYLLIEKKDRLEYLKKRRYVEEI